MTLMLSSCGRKQVGVDGVNGNSKVADRMSQKRIQKNIKYAHRGDLSLYLDLYLPEKKSNNPKLLVWFHGGGWRSGSKDECHISWMTEHGFAVASIQYRLSGQAKFPAQIHDCKEAIRYLRANSETYSYDSSQIGVAGISSGGQLATLLGTTGDRVELGGAEFSSLKDHSTQVHAVLNLCGTSDFIRAMNQFPQAVDDPNSTFGLLFGGPFSQKHELAKLASPATHVSKGDPPLLLVHGTKDPIVPFDQSEYMRDLYQQNGLEVKLITIQDGSHVPAEFWDKERRVQYLQFFEHHLKN